MPDERPYWIDETICKRDDAMPPFTPLHIIYGPDDSSPVCYVPGNEKAKPKVEKIAALLNAGHYGMVPLSLDRLREELLAADNIWTAIERIANSTGAAVGSHLETLLCREKHQGERGV